MRSLWRPKANILIVELEDDRFAFGFNTKQERTTIQRGGPWLYNKQSLLVLEETDDITHPTRMNLSFQEFWVQIKALPICYMTRQMGKLIGNILGEYVLTDQSRKEFQFGSILCVRVRIDVRKPLSRWVSVQLDGKVVQVDVRYEKLPLTCFLCGMMDHIEEQCEKFQGMNDDDRAKPYGRWFQDDVLGKDYRKPQGKKFGLDSEGGWSMKVQDSEDGDVFMGESEEGMDSGEADRHVARTSDGDGQQISGVPMISFGTLGQIQGTI